MLQQASETYFLVFPRKVNISWAKLSRTDTESLPNLCFRTFYLCVYCTYVSHPFGCALFPARCKSRLYTIIEIFRITMQLYLFVCVFMCVRLHYLVDLSHLVLSFTVQSDLVPVHL
jgi:hypothetical protein